MFERYTESARRTIFFARAEAGMASAEFIETEYLLLGLLRESDSGVERLLPPNFDAHSIRREIPKPKSKSVGHPVDLPLSYESKHVLAYAMEESERNGDRHIGCEHLLLGLLRDDAFTSARLLKAQGVNREDVEKLFEQQPRPAASTLTRDDLHALIDSLPDGAMETASRTLEHLQVWPPASQQVPPRIAELRQQMQNRMRQGLPPGTCGGGAGGGSWSTNTAGDVRDGSFSFTRSEDGGTVHETHRFHRGHEITIIERLRLSEDNMSLNYSQEITGPKDERRYEINFDLS